MMKGKSHEHQGRHWLLASRRTTQTAKHPSYKGSLTIDGRKYWLSGWKRHGDDGKPWLSLMVEQADEATDAKPQRT
jgi:hypothetical protein